MSRRRQGLVGSVLVLSGLSIGCVYLDRERIRAAAASMVGQPWVEAVIAADRAGYFSEARCLIDGRFVPVLSITQHGVFVDDLSIVQGAHEAAELFETREALESALRAKYASAPCQRVKFNLSGKYTFTVVVDAKGNVRQVSQLVFED